MKRTSQSASRWGVYAASLIFLLTFTFGVISKTAVPPSQDQAVQIIETTHIIPTIGLEENNKAQNKKEKTVANIGKLEKKFPKSHQDLKSSAQPELRKLAQYEGGAGGAIANGMMIFTNIPSSNTDLADKVSYMAGALKDFSKSGVTPIVIMEPLTDNGNISFAGYRAGNYDNMLNGYFNGLKKAGITDSQFGVWVYFAEANLPEWGPVDAANYAANVTRTVQIQKQYFPSGKASILLDAQSYPAGATNWDNGSYTSLKPFINGIPAGLLDSIGLQGFPWSPPANQSGATNYNPAIYLNSNIAAETASILGVKTVWLNTGTFRAMYANNKTQTVYMSPVQRQQLLNGVVIQAQNLKVKGYNVAVNLFCEDKSNVAEAIDWSYKSVDDQAVFNYFGGQLNSLDLSLWLFDR